tara:strand:+ start:3898 stop:4476 length:579 start_codon:yes stop_codon:yes gene_type:complete
MYLPKSKITPNLFSSGELLLSSTLKPYYGNYFSTVDGEFFTGKEPNDGPNNRLLLPQPSLDQDIFTAEDLRYTKKNFIYSVITNQPTLTNTPTPIPFNPQPIPSDYQTGEIIRYFSKKRNETLYTEIDSKNFTSLNSNPIYLPFNFPWVISGDESQVKLTNQKMVELIMRNLPIPSFNQFLKNDYTKFWKPS